VGGEPILIPIPVQVQVQVGLTQALMTPMPWGGGQRKCPAVQCTERRQCVPACALPGMLVERGCER